MGRALAPGEQEQEDQKGVTDNEYDLVFHFLLVSLRRADGSNSVTSAGVKTLDIFAGLGRWGGTGAC